MGEFEVRYPLRSLEEGTSTHLTRILARVLGVVELIKADDGAIKGYCRKLFNNPLLIKWFVASVGRGMDPNRLLSSTSDNFGEALRFCFQNLFDKFGDSERAVMNILACARRPVTVAELHYLGTHLSDLEIEVALSSLHNSSIVSRVIAQDGGNEYALSESASRYLSVHAAPSSETFKEVQERLRELRVSLERDALAQSKYEYDAFSVRSGKTRDEKISAIYLRRALDFLKSDLERAREAVEDARKLTPSNSEVWRVAALVESKLGDLFRATENYEQAVSLGSDSRIANYSFGIFLMSELGDAERALAYFEKAESLDPESSVVQTAKAMALARLGRYESAASIYERQLSGLSERERRWRIAGVDQAAECYRRWANRDVEQKEFDSAKRHIARAVHILCESAARGDVDPKLTTRIAKVLGDGLSRRELAEDEAYASALVRAVEDLGLHGTKRALPIERECGYAIRCLESIGDTSTIQRLIRLGERATSAHGEGDQMEIRAVSSNPKSDAEVGETIFGTVHNVLIEKRYGFIQDEAARRWFFHFNSLLDSHAERDLTQGRRVSFVVGLNHVGKCATRVSLS